MTETRQPTAIDQIADDYTVAVAEFQPETATDWGISGHDHRLSDYSPDGIDAVAELNRNLLAKIAETPCADRTDEVTVAAMRDRIGLSLEAYEAGEYHAMLNNIASPLQGIREIFDLMPTETTEQWATIAARIGAVPNAVDGYIESLRFAASRGLVAASRQVAEGIRQAEDLADPKSSFFVQFAAGATPDGAPADGTLAEDLTRNARAAAEAYGRLKEFLASELAPVAPTDDAVGRDRYSVWSRYFVSATVDLDETYEWGLAELAQVSAEMDEVAAQIVGPGASVAEAIAALEADPANRLHGTEALREWMQATADDAIARLNGTQFDIAEPIRRLEAMIAPTQTGGIYYTGPSEDFSRPGRMWWSVPPGVTEFQTWSEKTTVYHEGVPGHHLQIAQAVANRAELNMWRRLACFTSGHGEGWALYAERLMDEFGFLTTPGERLGMLDSQRLRAGRVVVDIGVHLAKPAPEEYGGGTWNAVKAWDLLRRNVTMSDPSLQFELTRYLGWPGQAPSYKIGQRIWEQIRADAEAAAQARGETFSLKDFHTRALNLGSLPLGVLRDELAK